MNSLETAKNIKNIDLSLDDYSFSETELTQFIDWIGSLSLDSFLMSVKLAEMMERKLFKGEVLEAFAKLKVKDKRLA